MAVEKLPFSQNKQKLGGRKCLGDQKKSFIGFPGAIYFFVDFRESSCSTATGVITISNEVGLVKGVLISILFPRRTRIRKRDGAGFS